MPALASSANEKADEEGGLNIPEIVLEHLSDSYEWHIATYGDNHISIPLPIIIRSDATGEWHFCTSHSLPDNFYFNKEMHGKIYEKLGGVAAASPYASDYYYNVGNVAVSAKDWQAAVEAYRQSLLRNPSDMDAKENYIYAKKMLENQQNQGGGQDQNQDKDQNQDNKDGGNDQDRNGNDNKDRGQDNGQDQNQDRNQGEGQGQQGKITPQAAQQILQAIQAKEKETQDKVKKEKAQVLKSRQKEKNW